MKKPSNYWLRPSEKKTIERIAKRLSNKSRTVSQSEVVGMLTSVLPFDRTVDALRARLDR